MQHFLNAVIMHVSEVVVSKNCSTIFDETKSQLQTFLSLSSFVTKLIEVLKVFKSFKSKLYKRYYFSLAHKLDKCY